MHIRFETLSNMGGRTSVNDAEFTTIANLVVNHADLDIRVVRDPEGLKVYAGPENNEVYRYWVYYDGNILVSEIANRSDNSTVFWTKFPEAEHETINTIQEGKINNA